MDPTPRKLGKYEILSRVAVGGMGEIFAAKLAVLPDVAKIVAVKRLLPRLAGEPSYVRMFLDEARIASMLEHPNIVQIHEIAREGDEYLIVMEYLHGEDLWAVTRALADRRRLPLGLALHVLIGVCAGLHYAHEKTDSDGKPLFIVHRDVSPHNVFLTFDVGVKLLDFGIAKAASRASVTRSRKLRGKVGYMSPEQVRAEPLDRRSDVYNAGILLYELTTGARLHGGKGELAIRDRIVAGAIAPPSALGRSYPARLEAITLRALAVDRKARHQTALELEADLEAFVRDERLVASNIALSAYMRETFGGRRPLPEAGAGAAGAEGDTDVLAAGAGAEDRTIPDGAPVDVQPPPPGPRRRR